ncbi:MAG: N-acyl homoserine lactonase family protein [Thermoplasmatota archaeon]
MEMDGSFADSLEVLSDGTFQIDGGMLVYGVPRYYGKCFRAKLKPMYVEAGDERILVDTGIGELSEKLNSIYKVEKDLDLPASLKRLSLSPEDISLVINTHLHFDHTGYNPLFTSARFISQEDEIRYSADPDRFQKGGYHQPNIKDLDYAPVKGKKMVAPGVMVVPTPGHTPGHQSVIVELEDEVYVYTGDVSPLSVNHDKKYIVGVLYNPVDALRSLQLLDDMRDWWNKPVKYIYSHE